MSSKKDEDLKDVEMAPLKGGDSSSSGGSSASKVLHHPPSVNTKAAYACAMYSFCSVSMVLVNKSLASSYNQYIQGDLNVLLVVFQAVVAVISVDLCKRMKLVEYPPLNFRTAQLWAPVNILFCLMLFTGMAALQHNNVPMVTIFKNITNIVVTVGDYFFFQTTADSTVWLAFGVMLTGAVAAAWHDITATFVGVFWMIANCLATAGYILYMKFATKNVKLTKFGMVYVNNVLCIVFLLPVALYLSQVSLFFKSPAIHTMDYFFKNLFAGFVGFFLNFASLNCVAATGPTTYAIVGSLNKIPVAILGYMLFDSVITRESWFFICVSMAGGFLYSYEQIAKSGRPKTEKSEASK